MVYRSLSLWPRTKHFYSIILDYTSQTVGTSSFINFWNDKRYATTSLTDIVGLSYGASIPYTVSQFWTGGDQNIPLSLQKMPHLFSHIMVGAKQDIPNQILNESGRLTLKSARTFFLDAGVPCGWGKFIWSSYIPPSKTLVLWKVFRGRLSMCTLCEKHE